MAFVLVALSVLLFALHVAVFRDLKGLAFYLALDVVFVPIQVLLVTLILERLLEERERLSMIRKLNMVVGAFFGEVGSDLARRVGRLCGNAGELAQRLAVDVQWTDAEFRAATRFAESFRGEFARDRDWLSELRGFLLAKRSFVLGLLQNPNLLEHDRFTDALWAVCHLTEELEARTDPATLPDSDVDHLIADVHRAFGMLMREWLAYMRHLQDAYPYMYSLAVRANPFRPDASPVVR
ncbi:MAG: hypothetical protein HZB55_01500 [Deltaproteobacteria bacterium]|nr:hypothetical protein [Deltaproteobacteria bacterium]